MTDDKKIPMPEMDTEAATRQQDPWNQGFMGAVQTNDPLILERGDAGSLAFEIYRDLRRDGKVFSGLQKRKLAVIGRPWTVEPEVESEQGSADAAIVADVLGSFAFDRLCSGLLDALLIGWQPAEVVWTLRQVKTPLGARQMVVPARVPKRLQRRFVYRDTTPGKPAELRLLTRDAMQDGVPVDERKFIVHTLNAEDDNPYGTGLGLQLYWPVFFKRKGVLAWNKLCDRFGTPTPWGKYPRNATAREKGTLFEALRAFSNDGFVMTPEGTLIELLESKLSAGGQTPNQSLVEYMDDWIMEVILGQSPRGGGGGALAAAATEREDVRLELSQADSDLLSETLNSTLIKWICEFNGLQPCLVYRDVSKEADTNLESETDKNVASLGFQMSTDGVKKKYGDHWEPASAPVPPKGTLPGDTKPANFAEPGPISPPGDALDALIDAEQDQWRPVMDPLVGPIKALLADAQARGQSAAELLARLPELLPQLGTDNLASSLTRVAFAARLAADAGMANE